LLHVQAVPLFPAEKRTVYRGKKEGKEKKKALNFSLRPMMLRQKEQCSLRNCILNSQV